MRLIVENLSCTRGGRRVFAGASFEVQGGAFTALRGPNGAGKSSLLRALCGLTPIDEGDARITAHADAAVSLANEAETFQEFIAYAAHSDAVKPSLSVHENLSFWARLYGEQARVDAALAQFALDHIADASAAYCSAGQARRLGLARLAVTKRPIWLLDEPTVSLDAASTQIFADLVKAHCAGGGVVIAATHIDLGLSEGRIVQMADFAPKPVQTLQDDPFLSGEGWA